MAETVTEPTRSKLKPFAAAAVVGQEARKQVDHEVVVTFSSVREFCCKTQEIRVFLHHLFNPTLKSKEQTKNRTLVTKTQSN